MKQYAIVLAAGKGKRMKSALEDTPKVLFPILGTPMIEWVYEAIKPLNVDEIITVAGFGGNMLKPISDRYGKTIWQDEQKGTGHAVLSTASELENEEGSTLVLLGDMPLLTEKTLSALLSAHHVGQNAATLLVATVDDPYGNGRVIRKAGRIVDLVEQKDCGPEESAIHQINARVYAFDNKKLFAALRAISPVGNELHLSDAVRYLIKSGERVGAFMLSDPEEALRVSDRYELSLAAKKARMRIIRRHMEQGVSFEDPDTAYIGPHATLSKDVVIKPNTHVLGDSRIGPRCFIGPDTYLENVVMGNDNRVTYSHLRDTVIGDNNELGPYLRTRGDVKIGNNIVLGNFNELKHAEIGDGTMCMHHAYLGDVTVGEKANIGCGVIVANFDGVEKHQSTIADHAFVGSGSVLISPVNLGEGSFVAAGSVITDDVPKDALAIARGRQENKEGKGKTLLNPKK